MNKEKHENHAKQIKQFAHKRDVKLEHSGIRRFKTDLKETHSNLRKKMLEETKEEL
jgi:hypothetical protein